MFYLILIIVSLLLSFFFSGTETAFVSVNKVRVEVWRRRKDRVARVILPFLINPERFIYTTLIGNNIFNVAFASLATVYFNRYLDAEVTWMMIVVTTIMIGEIIPKTLFRSLADWVVRKISYPLEMFYRIFLPLIFIVSKISEIILSIFGYKKEELRLFFSQKDIEILLSESREIIRRHDPVEGEFLSGILSLKELWVRDAMVPRTEIIAVPRNISLKELTQVFNKYGHTKLPVFNRTLDDIIGVVFLKDLFLEPHSFQEMIRPVMFVPETKRCSELLSEFRNKNTTIAIVIDEYGGTAGLITTEDLIEELFGEIEDEYDAQEVLIRKIDERSFKVNARIEIQKLNQMFGLSFPEGEYETLAGFLLTQLGHIPRRDETMEYNEVKMTVTSATRRKIKWIRIDLP